MGARGDGGGDGEPGLPRPGRHRLVAAAPALVAAPQRSVTSQTYGSQLLWRFLDERGRGCCTRTSRGASVRAKTQAGQASSRRTSGSRKNRSPRRSVASRCGRPTGTAIGSRRCGDSRAAGAQAAPSHRWRSTISGCPGRRGRYRCASPAAAVRRLSRTGSRAIVPATRPRPAGSALGSWTAVAS